eukprot:scaffold2501_cov423-Prasinococcus_capsulatus_cf.AAC.11
MDAASPDNGSMPKHGYANATQDSVAHVVVSVALFPAGLDAVKLRDGRVLLVYNHSFETGTAGRSVLALAISHNDGELWERILILEDSSPKAQEYSYPAIIQSVHDGLVHITYTHRRSNIKHVTIDPEAL